MTETYVANSHKTQKHKGYLINQIQIGFSVRLSAADERRRTEVRGYFAAVEPGLEGARDEAVKAAGAFLERNRFRNFRDENEFAERLWGEMAGAFGERMESDKVKAEVAKAIEAVYKYYRISDRSAWRTGKAPARFAFGRKDFRTMEFAGRLDQFYLGKFITNDSSRAAGFEFLKKQYLELD